MIIPSQVKQKFRDTTPIVEQIAERVSNIIQSYGTDKGYPFVGRCKTADSLIEKIESGRYRQWDDLDDLYACTIVVPTLNHEPEVLNFLQNRFKEVTLRQRGNTRKSPEIFRFEATRFIGRIKPPPTVSDAEPLYQQSFEVQIRTAFEHAWSAATHALVYKSGDVEWNRLRMAAQLKAAVEQLDYLVIAFDTSAETIITHQWPEVDLKIQILSRLKPLVDEGYIPATQEPKIWSRFADNLYSLVRAGSHCRPYELPKKLEGCLDTLASEIRKMNKKAPTSLSLMQLATGILLQEGQITAPLENFWPLVTPELIDFYPSTEAIVDTFRFDELASQ